jgi:cytochrome oxidase assembly protein ShyY1
MTLITLVLLALFVVLGRWQWHRGEAKQAVWSSYERNDATPAENSPVDFNTAERFKRVALSGRFDASRQFLLDNISHAGQPGYEVLTPFLLNDGRRILVNRGWVPFTGYRDRLPDVSMTISTAAISGRIDELPSPGLASGRAPPDVSNHWPKVTAFPTIEELEKSLDDGLVHRILLLDPAPPELGYVREWSPPGMPPSRHFSYAIQWWGFAAVLLVLYFGLNFRKVS